MPKMYIFFKWIVLVFDVAFLFVDKYTWCFFLLVADDSFSVVKLTLSSVARPVIAKPGFPDVSTGKYNW